MRSIGPLAVVAFLAGSCGSSGGGTFAAGTGGDTADAGERTDSSTGGVSNSGGSVSSTGGKSTGTGSAGGMPPGATGGGGAAGEGGNGGKGSIECQGQHPNVSTELRYCNPDSCYCTDPVDTCFTEETAQVCCKNAPICGGDGQIPGISCAGKHPIIGPPRTCEPGYCLCSMQGTIDTCLPENVARTCCPRDIELQCVKG